MAGSSYKVTQSVKAEMAAIRAVTAAIQKEKVRKSGETTAIRSWRFKYRAWKNHITPVKSVETEDTVVAEKRMIRAYNRSLRVLNRRQSLAADEDLERVAGELVTLRHRIGQLRSQAGVAHYASELTDSEEKTGQWETAVRQLRRAAQEHTAQKARYEDSMALQRRYQRDLEAYDEARRLAQQVEAQNEDRKAEYQQALKRYQKQSVAYAEYRKRLAEYEKQLDQYQDEKAEYGDLDVWTDTLQPYADDLNANDYSVTLATVDPEKIELRPTPDGVSTITGAIITSYQNYRDRGMGLERFLELGIMGTLGNPDFSSALDAAEDGDLDGAKEAIKTTLSAALSQYLASVNSEPELAEARRHFAEGQPTPPVEPEPVAQPVEPEKPQLRPVEEPKKPVEPEKVEKPAEIEPAEVPTFTGEITYTPVPPENPVDETLIAELDGFATGSYDGTRGHFEELNAVAEKAGHGCPKIELVDTSFDPRALLSAVGELESAMSQFGSQKNSGTGIAIVRKVESAKADLASASTYSDFMAAAKKFDAITTQLFMWITGRWWQFGGTPSGDAHPWKGMGKTRRLKMRKR